MHSVGGRKQHFETEPEGEPPRGRISAEERHRDSRKLKPAGFWPDWGDWIGFHEIEHKGKRRVLS